MGSSANKVGEWPVVGIDLRTTYSCVGVWQNDRVEIITNDQGNRTTPSLVAFGDFESFIGEGAQNQATRNSANTIFGHHLRKIGHVKTVSEIRAEEARKVNKLVSNLTNELKVKNKSLKEIEN